MLVPDFSPTMLETKLRSRPLCPSGARKPDICKQTEDRACCVNNLTVTECPLPQGCCGGASNKPL